MKASNRLIINTLAQYCRTIINVLLSLYSARLVLEIIGVSDYGLYTLVAGVVSMLSFFTNSLVTSTQRFLSVAQGRDNNEAEVRNIFNSSMIVHLGLGLVIIIVLAFFTPLLFNGFLNIPNGRESVAKMLYIMVLGMLFVTFITAPYRASLISRENIVYISIVDVLDGILKVILVITLQYITYDKLLSYGCIMLGIQCFNLLAFAVYGHIKYDECRIPKLKYWDFEYSKKLLSFAGWTMYSTFCIAGRNQGVAIVLNKAMGTAINAAYGIGMQISGYLSFLSSSFMTAIAPQLMKAKGGDNYTHAMYLAEFQSRISYILLAVIAIPAMSQIEFILGLWLKDVPNHTSLFAIMFIASMLIDQLTVGLGTLVTADGNIKRYTLICNTPKFLILPIAYFLLRFNQPLWTIALLFFTIEGLIMLSRLVVLRKQLKFTPSVYVKHVMAPIVLPTIMCITLCLIIHFVVISDLIQFLMTFIVGMIVYSISTYYISLTKEEQGKIKSILSVISAKFA